MRHNGGLRLTASVAVLSIFALVLLAGGELGAGETTAGLTADEIYGFAQVQAGFGPRRPGLPAMDQARDDIVGHLEEWGYKVWIDSMPFEQYFPEKWGLELVAPTGRALDGFPLWHSGPAGPDGITAELVDVGKGSERDFARHDVAGKVVLVSYGHRFLNLMSLGAFSNTYARAIEHGAVGFLQYFTNTPGNTHQLVFVKSEGTGPAIPGFSIGKEDAAYLKKLTRKGGVKVRMELASEERVTLAQNIFAVLPGRTDDVILVDTHYCSIFEGAFDNASGTAAALALAKYFAMKPVEQREKTLVFTFYGSHEYMIGDIGSRKFLDDNPEVADNLLVAIGLDHMANYPDKEYFGHDTRIRPMTPFPGMDQPRGIFVTNNSALRSIVFPAMLRHRLVPFIVFPNGLMDSIDVGAPGDKWDSLLMWCICESGPAFRRNVPTIRIMMAPQTYHTPLDTMEHFTPEQLKRAVDAHIEIIEKIDQTPPEKFRR